MNIITKLKKNHLGIVLLVLVSLLVLNGCDALENEPTASFTIDKHPEGTPLKVVVDASDSEGSESKDGAIQKYEWDFGDGTTSSGRYVVQNHTYSSSGKYTITLTVTNHEGNSDTVKRTFTIEEKTAPDETEDKDEKESTSEDKGIRETEEESKSYSENQAEGELKIIDWEIKKKKAGYPGNYRIEAWAEGTIKNVGEGVAENCLVYIEFRKSYGEAGTVILDGGKDTVSQMWPGATWDFRVPCTSRDEQVNQAGIKLDYDP